MDIGPVKRQSLIHLITNISITAVGFLSTIYFAHFLGPSILGAYFLFTAYFSVFNLVTDGGFGSAAAKRISEGKEQNEYFSASLLLRLALLAATIAFLFAFNARFIDLNTMGLFWWLIMALCVSTISGVIQTANYGSAKSGIVQVSVLCNNLLRIIVQVIAVYLGFQVAGLAGGFIAGFIAGAVVNYRFLELHLSRFSRRHLRSLFSFSFWSFLSAGGALVFTSADTILIGYFMGNSDVGVYRVALQLASLGVFVALALQNVLYPKFSLWNEENRHDLIVRALGRAYTYSLVLALPACIGGWIMGDYLMYYLYGEVFTSGTVALAILLAVHVVYIFVYLQMMCLGALNHPRESFRVTAIAAALNIVLDFILIPIIGITGAAVATLVTFALYALLGYRVLSGFISVRFEREALKNIVLASVLMGAVILVLRLVIPLISLFVLVGIVALGAIIYFVILVKIDSEIRVELKELVEQLGLPWPVCM
jgi:O-antigen/teichoic acid export membrane protein